MTKLTVADVLDQGAAVLQRNGWHQGGFYRMPGLGHPENCAVCAMGAINIAVFGVPQSPIRVEPWQYQLADAAYRAVENFLHWDSGLGTWNDLGDRTAGEVVAALRGAAQAERERAAPPS